MLRKRKTSTHLPHTDASAGLDVRWDGERNSWAAQERSEMSSRVARRTGELLLNLTWKVARNSRSLKPLLISFLPPLPLPPFPFASRLNCWRVRSDQNPLITQADWLDNVHSYIINPTYYSCIITPTRYSYLISPPPKILQNSSLNQKKNLTIVFNNRRSESCSRVTGNVSWSVFTGNSTLLYC